jgi:hypothetical protein
MAFSGKYEARCARMYSETGTNCGRSRGQLPAVGDVIEPRIPAAEGGCELLVQHPRADLEQQMCPARRPAHLGSLAAASAARDRPLRVGGPPPGPRPAGGPGRGCRRTARRAKTEPVSRTTATGRSGAVACSFCRRSPEARPMTVGTRPAACVSSLRKGHTTAVDWCLPSAGGGSSHDAHDCHRRNPGDADVAADGYLGSQCGRSFEERRARNADRAGF